jgi:ABC-2 type transport system permease protein
VTALRNIGAILEKEWRHYFGSPIAYVALCMWTLLFGFFYNFAVEFFLRQSMMMSQQMEFGGGPKLSMNEYLIRPVMQNMAVVALFILPMLTMRLYAEEKRTGTIELLATSPITDWQIVLGKFLGALALYVLMIVVGLINVALLWYFASSPPEWKPVVTGALALLLVGASFISLGLFLSTLTRNQIVAGILGFGFALMFWIFSWFDQPTATRPSGAGVPRHHQPHGEPGQGCDRAEGRRVLRELHRVRAVPGAAVGREPALEGVTHEETGRFPGAARRAGHPRRASRACRAARCRGKERYYLIGGCSDRAHLVLRFRGARRVRRTAPAALRRQRVPVRAGVLANLVA